MIWGGQKQSRIFFLAEHKLWKVENQPMVNSKRTKTTIVQPMAQDASKKMTSIQASSLDKGSEQTSKPDAPNDPVDSTREKAVNPVAADTIKMAQPCKENNHSR